MSVFAYLASAWKKAKCVWWWDGAAWQKAQTVHYYDGATWQVGYQRPSMANTLSGATTSASYPADITFTWTITGQLYGATFELFGNGISYVGPFDLEANPTGYGVSAVDPTMTWTVETRDGNGDLVVTRTATITGP
jgi:hypothetical protein